MEPAFLEPTPLPPTLIRAALLLFVYIRIYLKNTFLCAHSVPVLYFLGILLARPLTDKSVCSLSERFICFKKKFEILCCVQYFLRILFRRWKHFPGKVILAVVKSELSACLPGGGPGWRRGKGWLSGGLDGVEGAGQSRRAVTGS